jgi:hypothetical protein
VPDAIARFEAAYGERVGALPAPPTDARSVRSLEELIAPLRLPDALRRWWERLAPSTLPMGADQGPLGRPFEAEFLDPARVYYRWLAARDHPGRMPEALLPVSAWGDTVRFADLTAGGAMYVWTVGTPYARPWVASVEDWIDLAASALRDEASRVLELGGGARWVILRMPEIKAHGPPIDLRDRAAWPAAWRDASRLFEGRRAVPERALSISELQWAAGAGTVCGAVSESTRTAAGSRLEVLGGTGWLDAWCPADVPGLWLVRDPALFELDVSTDVGAWPPDAADDAPNVLQRAIMAAPPEAVVTAVRLRSYG